MTRSKVVAVVALFLALSLGAYAEEVKGSFSSGLGVSKTNSNFFEGQGGKKFSFSFRLSVNPWHERGNFLRRLSIEPSFVFSPVHSENTSDGAYKLRERLYQPGLDLGFKALDTNRFDIIAYGGTSFSRDSFTVAQRSYGRWVNVCRYIQEGVCRGNWNMLGRGGARFLYHPKKDSKFFLGFDVNTRKQYMVVLGTEF